jgi:hypothetical protein
MEQIAGPIWELNAVWRSMVARCYNLKNTAFKHYGARGITVCDGWRNDFFAFKRWALRHGWCPAPSDRKRNPLSMDRIDNSGPYAPGNCRLATPKEQAQNRRTTRVIAAFGETKTTSGWSEDPRCLVSATTLRSRIRRGLKPEDAISRASLRRVRPT